MASVRSCMFAANAKAECFPVSAMPHYVAERRTLELRVEKQGSLGHIKTLADAMRKYAAEVSPQHKGERWEVVRLDAFE